MKKVIAIFGFMALMAMMGMASAEFIVEITNPVDGATVLVGSTVMVQASTTAINEDNIYSRLWIDGERAYTSAWTPTEIGPHLLEVRVANNPEFTNPTIGMSLVNVIAAPVNKRIKAVNELFTGISRTEDTYIDAPGILANDIGQGLSVYEPESIVLSDPSKGQIYVEADGSFVFTPAEGVRKGYVLFYYKVTDGNLISNIGTAKLSLI